MWPSTIVSSLSFGLEYGVEEEFGIEEELGVGFDDGVDVVIARDGEF